MSTNSTLHNISIDLWVIRSRPERYGCAHLNVKEKSDQLIYPKQNQFPKARNIDRDHHKTGTQPGIRSPQLNPKPSGAPSFARLIGRRVGNAHSLPGLLCLCLSSLLITRYSLLVHKSPWPYPNPIPLSYPVLILVPVFAFALLRVLRALLRALRVRSPQTPVITGESPPLNYFSRIHSAKSNVKPPNPPKNQ